MGGAVVDAPAQYVDDAALADLCGHTGQELEAVDVPRVVNVGDGQLLELLGLGSLKEGEELSEIEAVGAVIISGAPGEVT